MSFDTVRQLALDAVRADDLRPQAVLRCSPERLSRRLGIRFERGEDDLDGFEAAALLLVAETSLVEAREHALQPLDALLEDRPPSASPLMFMVQRYDGEPGHALTLFLPASMTSGEEIASAVERVTAALHLGAAAATWQRSDDPAL